jgi:hypothetical protein
MALSKRMMSVGFSAEMAKAANAGQLSINLVALANATQTGAAPITGDFTTIGTSTAGNNSVILPSDAVSSDWLTIVTVAGLGNAVNVYPPVGGQINAAGANVVYSMAASKAADFICVGSLTWVTNPVAAT